MADFKTAFIEPTFSAKLNEDDLEIKYGIASLSISFQRTIRVADNNETSGLPPDLGEFPLYLVSDYAQNMPETMAAKGGIFFPIYEREAMWISFYASKPFALKIFAGGVNVISGEPQTEDSEVQSRRLDKLALGQSIQDYVVPPDQHWLDGIASHDGKVRQFVAMQTGQGYSIEAQVTGKDTIAGLQFEVTPMYQPAVKAPFGKPVSFNVRNPYGRDADVTLGKNDNIGDVKDYPKI